MGVEQGGPSEVDIKPNEDKVLIHEIPLEEDKKVSRFQKIKKSLGFGRKHEIETVSLLEIELPEYEQWLDEISFHPKKVNSYVRKIKNPKVVETVSKLEKDSEKYYGEALDTTDPKEKRGCERLGYSRAGLAWVNGLETYIDEQGDSFLERMRDKIINGEELNLYDKEGLSMAISSGLSEALMIPTASHFDDRDDYLRLIYSDIEKRNPNPHLSNFNNPPSGYGYGLFEGHQSMINSAPSYAILTFERTDSSKELLSFAIERLERMGSIWGGGLVSGSEKNDSKIPMVRNEVIRAGDCLILAARLSRLLGENEKQKELYERAYSFFGEIGKEVSGFEGLTGITQELAQSSYPNLVRRIVECAKGADLPEAEIWEEAYERATGKKKHRTEKIYNIEPDKELKSEQKSLPEKGEDEE